jgi:hypothetical protein
MFAGGGADARKGKHVRYIGIHPVPVAHGGGLCHIEAPHVHLYAPGDARLQYRDHRGHHYFVGDPVAYGWEGVTYTYVGHHPIEIGAVVGPIDGTIEVDSELCFLDGAHYHAFAPPPAIAEDFEHAGGAYFFVGDPPPAYDAARPALVEVNELYTPITYERPVVTVTPPTAWIGVRVVPAKVKVEIKGPTYKLKYKVKHHHKHKHKHHKHKHKHGHHGHGHGHGHGHDHDDDDDDWD